MNSSHSQRTLLEDHYQRYLIDQHVGTFVRRVSDSYTVGSLERVARAGNRTTRRAAVLALGRMADYRANATLGRALVDRDRGVRSLAENSIRRLWMRIGTPEQQRHLAAIQENIENREHERAAQLATALAEDAPWIAQAWYFRGQAFFQLEQYAAATQDCEQALEMNCYHFLAGSVMGQAYLEVDNRPAALAAFRRTLRLNPNMEEVRAQIVHLQRSLKRK